MGNRDDCRSAMKVAMEMEMETGKRKGMNGVPA
jgi:hypothetical protein